MEPANSRENNKGTKEEGEKEAEAVHRTGTSEAPDRQQPETTA